MPQAVEIVRGKIVGGTDTVFLIAVDERWGRVFNISTRQLFALAPLDTAFRMVPSFGEPFDGSEDDEENILNAALAYDWLEPAIDGYNLPAVDIIDHE